MRGRKPKPAGLRKLEGDTGHRPAPKAEPQPTGRRPACPQYFHPYARREWRRVVPELERLGLLTQIDGAALEAYCVAYSNMVRAAEEIKADLSVVTPTKFSRPSPYVAIFNQAAALVRAFCTEFGLTPAARVRLSGPGDSAGKGKGRNTMESFLAGDDPDAGSRALLDAAMPLPRNPGRAGSDA